MNRAFQFLSALAMCITPAIASAEAVHTYTFGVLSQRSAVLTAQYWNPIIDHIQKKTGVMLALKVARTAPESNDAIERGEFDFVYSNTIFQPRMAVANYQVILRPREEAITGQIVTLEDSPVKSLNGLEKREVGFPSLAAFVGYAVPMDQLLREKITVTPLFGGNQEGIMGQLKTGRVIAAGVNGQVMKSFAARESIRYRVLWESQAFLNLPIAAHPRVPNTVVESVKAAIDNMDADPSGMQILEASAKIIGQQPPLGFRASSPADYQSYADFYKHTLVKDFK